MSSSPEGSREPEGLVGGDVLGLREWLLLMGKGYLVSYLGRHQYGLLGF